MKHKGFPYCKSGWNLHMMPIGYLMIEHRLIERMVKLMAGHISVINKRKKADVKFLNIVIDFIKTYADKCHHGKEEDILFRELLKRRISSAHKKGVKELIREHKLGRVAVGKLVDSEDDYVGGKRSKLSDIKKQIKWLVEFYPKHIAKEDKKYFIPFMSYFNKREQDGILLEFCRFDGTSIQDTYRKRVYKLEKNI